MERDPLTCTEGRRKTSRAADFLFKKCLTALEKLSERKLVLAAELGTTEAFGTWENTWVLVSYK